MRIAVLILSLTTLVLMIKMVFFNKKTKKTDEPEPEEKKIKPLPSVRWYNESPYAMTFSRYNGNKRTQVRLNKALSQFIRNH